MRWTDRCAGEFHTAFLRKATEIGGDDALGMAVDIIDNNDWVGGKPTFGGVFEVARRELINWTRESELAVAQIYLDVLKALEEFAQ